MNYLDLLDEYLDQTLSAEQQQAFDAALATDAVLQNALVQEQAIRAQFAYQKTKQKVLLLQEKMKKEAAFDKALQEQFDYKKTEQKVLALQEKMKSEKKTVSEPTPVAKVIAMPQEILHKVASPADPMQLIPRRNNFYRWAAAASVIGLGVCLFLFNQNKTENDETANTPPPIEIESPVIEVKKDSIVEKQSIEDKIVSLPEKDKQSSNIKIPKKQETPKKDDRLSTANPMIDEIFRNEQFDIFYERQIARVEVQLMNDDKETKFKNAKVQLKKGDYEYALSQLNKLHVENPDSKEVALYLALCHYKMGKNGVAIEFLKGIKVGNSEVEDLLAKFDQVDIFDDIRVASVYKVFNEYSQDLSASRDGISPNPGNQTILDVKTALSAGNAQKAVELLSKNTNTLNGEEKWLLALANLKVNPIEGVFQMQAIQKSGGLYGAAATKLLKKLQE
jgi:hypothetical protein